MDGVLLLLALQTAGAFPAALPLETEPALARRDVVLRWNEAALQAIRAEGTPPPQAARNLAILHAAIYDAVNAVTRTHQSYRFEATPPPDTSPESAAAVAGHRILVALYPQQTECFDAILDESLAAVPNGEARTAGLQLGQVIAERYLAWRRQDGSRRQAVYLPPAAPGVWRPTPPAYNDALLPQWPAVVPFCMRSGSQFRPPAPPTLTTAAYAASFVEVKLLGDVTSTARTPEQTEIAFFWADDKGTVTPPGHWNRIAQTVALQRGTTLAENARLFALLNLALADAGIVCWDGKYHYGYWRPVHAIREADPGLNPYTTPDPDWTPLLTTPPFPSYASGHSTFSGAAAAVLAHFFGTDAVVFTSTSDTLPGVRRTYAGFWAAAEEAGKSRIYGGIHWEFDNREGLICGRAVGDYVSRLFLLPHPTGDTVAPEDAPIQATGRVMKVVPWRKRPRE